VGAIYRNDASLGAKGGTSAAHGGSEAGNGEATDDTNYTNVLGCPTAYTQRNSGSAVRIHPTPLGGETRMVSTPGSIARWLMLPK
jgi:hypothetical protein